MSDELPIRIVITTRLEKFDGEISDDTAPVEVIESQEVVNGTLDSGS